MNKLKYKISRSELEALLMITRATIQADLATSYGDRMVRELMLEVCDQMGRMCDNREQKKFTLKLSPAQKLAFLAFWRKIDLSKCPYESVLIHNINQAIHKQYLEKLYS